VLLESSGPVVAVSDQEWLDADLDLECNWLDCGLTEATAEIVDVGGLWFCKKHADFLGRRSQITEDDRVADAGRWLR
jgi:hypothetical protein